MQSIRRVALCLALAAGATWAVGHARRGPSAPARPEAAARVVIKPRAGYGLHIAPVAMGQVHLDPGERARERERKLQILQVLAARDTVLVTAFRQIGIPYVWGGESREGFDCSGLIQYSFRAAGYDIPRRAIEQATMGEEIPLDLGILRPGDLLYFQAREGIDHTGIYLGGGKYLHASSSRGMVAIGELDGGGDQVAHLLVAARRVFLLPYRTSEGDPIHTRYTAHGG